MTISCLHHINIQTDRIEETRDFYERVLGLYVGARPNFNSPGYWLFAPGTDHPIVHLSLRREDDEGPDRTVDAGNRLDHVAFFGRDLEGTLAGLDEMGVPYDVHPDRLYLDGKMVQVFLKDPNGINVELGFFPHRDDMFAKSMAEYQAAARAGDRKLKGRTGKATKARKAKRDKVPA